MSEESQRNTDCAGIVIAVLAGALFVLGCWAGRVTGTSESERSLIQQQKQELTELHTQLAEMRGRLDGFKEGRR